MPLEILPKIEYDKDYALDHAVNCNSQHSCLIQNNKLHMTQNSMDGIDKLKIYNLFDVKASIQEIELTNKKVFCAGTLYTVFYFCNKISLLTGKVDYRTLHLNLYQLDTEAICAHTSWTQVPFSKYSISNSLFDLEYCIPVSHREDRVIIVSILNDQKNKQHCIVFHMFFQKTSGRNWKAASSPLPIQFTPNVKHRIQSCKIDLEAKYIYCSVLLSGAGAYIYKFDLMSLQQHRKNCNDVSIKPVCNWHIVEPTLRNCFLSLHEEIIMISFNDVNDKNIMKVKRPINFLPAAPADYQFEFPSGIKIVAASIVSASKIVVVYHSNKTNQCFIKTITI